MDDSTSFELDRLAPPDEARGPDWADVLRRARPASRGRLRRALPAAAVVLAVAVPAAALSSSVRSTLSFDRAPLFTKARVLVTASVGNGFFAHALSVPTGHGRTCVVVSYSRTSSPLGVRVRPLRLRVARLPTRCSSHGSPGAATVQRPLLATLSVQPKRGTGDPRNWVPPVVFGSVSASLHATRVAVVWDGGSHELTLHDGLFLGGSPALYRSPPRRVVAYDATGHELASTTPHMLG